MDGWICCVAVFGVMLAVVIYTLWTEVWPGSPQDDEQPPEVR